jgi:hypothetical protein
MGRRAGPHLDKHDDVTVAHDEIDFRFNRAKVALDDAITLRLEVRRRDALAEGAERLSFRHARIIGAARVMLLPTSIPQEETAR